GKARAREFGGVLHVDHRARKFEMVARALALHAGLTDELDHLVLGARRGRGVGQIGQWSEGLVQALFYLRKLVAQVLLARAELTLSRDCLRGVLARALGLSDRIGRRIARSPQLLQARY